MSKKYVLLFALIIILSASLVRFVNIENNPAWYTDEGTHIEIAKHLITGENYYLGITDSYLIAARLPLFEHVLALWFRLIGVGMVQLRLLTAFLGILTLIILYRLAYLIFASRWIAIGVISIFSVYPQAVIYSRFGFSYNLLALFIISGLYFLIRFDRSNKSRDLIMACLLFGLGTISDFIGWSFIPVIVLLILIQHRRLIVLGVLCLSLPFGVYALLELLIHPQIFLHDLSYTLARAGGQPLHQQLDNLLKNIEVLMTVSWWMPVGVIGLLSMKPMSLRFVIVIVVGIPFIISGRTVALYNLSAYYMIPFLPFVALGIVSLIHRLAFVLPVTRQIRFMISVCVITSIFGATLMQNIKQIQSGFSVGIEHFLISSSEANQIQSHLFDYTKEYSTIITSPSLAWMFDGHVTDFQIASLVNGDSIHFPADLYPERIAFDINYKNANYAIVDNLWRDWGAVHMPYVADMLETIQTWDLIFETQSIQIYENPEA